MKHNGKTYFISSHSKHNTFSQNLDNDVKLLSKLRKLGYEAVMCTKCYKGHIEFSYMVNNNTLLTELEVLDLAKEFNQDSILCVYGINQTAEFIYTNGKRNIAGKMVNIGGKDGITTEPLAGRDYTYYNEEYYIIK